MTLFLAMLTGALLGAAVWAVGAIREHRHRQREIDRRELAGWAPIPRTRLDAGRRDSDDADGGRS